MINLTLFQPAMVSAQVLEKVHLGAWRGRLDLGYATNHQQISSKNGQDNEFESTQYDMRVELRNQGFYYLDPRFIKGNLGLTLGMFQSQQKSNDSKSSQPGNLIGYAFDATFLAGKPYSGTLYANKTENSVVRPFGGRTELSNELRGVTLRLRESSVLKDWGLPYFTTTLRVERHRLTESSTHPEQNFQRDESQDRVHLVTHKGFETSDLNFEYELTDQKSSFSTHGSNRLTRARMTYSLDFGPTLSRRWDSRLSYSDRSGGNPVTVFIADEELQILHHTRLSTNYRYLLSQIDTQTGKTTAHSGIFQLQHRLYQNLNSSVNVLARRRELPTGEQSTYAGRLGLGYQRSLPHNGQMFATIHGKYQLDDNQLTSSRVDAVDASHNAPPVLGAGNGFLLDNSFIDDSTIVVVVTQGGARQDALLGIDYDLFQEGNLIRIVPRPTSLVIQPGDSMAVSYTYNVDPSIKYTTVSSSLRTGADYRWIAFSVGHEETEQTPRSGSSGRFLDKSSSDTADLQLRGNWTSIRGEVGAAYKDYRQTNLAYTQQRYHQRVTYRPRAVLSLSFTAEKTRTDYTLPTRKTTSQALQLSMNWLAPGGWRTTGLVEWRDYNDSLSAGDTYSEARFTARKSMGKLSINAGMRVSKRMQGSGEADNWDVHLNLSRSF